MNSFYRDILKLWWNWWNYTFYMPQSIAITRFLTSTISSTIFHHSEKMVELLERKLIIFVDILKFTVLR